MSGPNYRHQDGCHNCKNCFIREDYDEDTTYYCTHEAPPRPPCMSVGMDECDMNDDEYSEANDLWEEWSADRGVRPWAICDSWGETK